MQNQQGLEFDQKARNMKLLFLFPSTYGTGSIMGMSLRTLAILATIIQIVIQAVICLIFFLNVYFYDLIEFINAVIISANLLIWLVALTGPISDKFKTAYTMTILVQAMFYLNVLATIIEIILVFIVYPNIYNNFIIVYYTEFLVYRSLFYYVIYVVMIYFYYSYTKNLGMSRNPPVLVNNTTIAYVHTNQVVSAYVPPQTVTVAHTVQPAYLNVNSYPQGEQVVYPTLNSISSIPLTHPGDVAFAQVNQNAIVSDATLPSGLKVPGCAEGKVWRIIGNEVILI
jgi:hypothetical protein